MTTWWQRRLDFHKFFARSALRQNRPKNGHRRPTTGIADWLYVGWVGIYAAYTPVNRVADQPYPLLGGMGPVCAQPEHDGDVLIPDTALIKFIEHKGQEPIGWTGTSHIAGDHNHPLPR